MSDDLETILARVAAGELSAEEAEPLVLAATASRGSDVPSADDDQPHRAPSDAEGSARGVPPAPAQRTVRLQVFEEGRVVVNLRIPVGLASLAGAALPGLSGQHTDRVREAIRAGIVGTILEVRDEDGDGVVISTE